MGGLLAHALGRVPIAGSPSTVGGLRLTAEPCAAGATRSLPSGERARGPAARPARDRTGGGGGTVAGRALTRGERGGARPGRSQDHHPGPVLAGEGSGVRGSGRPRRDWPHLPAAAVALPSLRLSALRLAVAMAVSSGAAELEAAALVSDAELDPGDLAVVRDLGPGATVFHAFIPRQAYPSSTSRPPLPPGNIALPLASTHLPLATPPRPWRSAIPTQRRPAADRADKPAFRHDPCISGRIPQSRPEQWSISLFSTG